VGSLCFVATWAISPLGAQTNETSKAPLSFYGLGKDQEICFTVYTNHPPASFGVEVSAQPQPQARMRLEMNASYVIGAGEKIWGHPAGEQIIRSLTPADMRTLQNFLTSFQTKGALPPPALSRQPAMAFWRNTYRINQEGHRYADTDRKDFYPVSEVAQRDFIKNFIGLNESGSN
jgi:hypothetical protein